MSGHKAGILLCAGMPVMIKKNIATDSCITNGAEANVMGWESHKVTRYNHDIEILDVPFVKLKNPAYRVQVSGLPENVIPITRLSKRIACTPPNGYTEIINCEKIDVLV